jgi:hypothetical protein
LPLLTDEEIAQAWEDCYGEKLPAEKGLVFGRTVRSRQQIADLRAIGAAGVWQDKPDKAGWWVISYKGVPLNIQLVKNPEHHAHRESEQWFFIKE